MKQNEMLAKSAQLYKARQERQAICLELGLLFIGLGMFLLAHGLGVV